MKTTNSYARIFLVLIAIAFIPVSVSQAQPVSLIPTQNTETPSALAPCDCKGWSDEPIKISSLVLSKVVMCGGSVSIKKGSYALTSSTYFCTPSTCLPTYIWNITGPVTGSHTGKTYGFTFSIVGTYTVTITPICGGHKCKPCKFKVVATL